MRLCTARTVTVVGALLGAALVVVLGLREFAFSDYEAEALPAIDLLLRGRPGGFLAALPGYGGALVLQAPFALVGDHIGGDRALWAWRLQAVPAFAVLLGLGIVAGGSVARALGGRMGNVWGGFTAFLVAGSPFALPALQAGHIEEVLVAGFVVSAVWLATREGIVTAAVIVGLATAAKPWAVIAIPVVLVAATDRRTFVRAAIACVAAVAVLTAPTALAGGSDQVRASVQSSTGGIFKPANVFWFAGAPNTAWGSGRETGSRTLFESDATKAVWAQRTAPAWAARLSHPTIVLFAVALAFAFWRTRRVEGRRPEDLLLLLATVCWWRCLLDTWNTEYYALGALLALTVWEARRGRPPLLAAGVTAMAWTTFEFLPWWKLTPDGHTAVYLAWALPVGGVMVWRLIAPELLIRALRPGARLIATKLPTLVATTTPSRVGRASH